jgi:uncharacterized protein YbaP (TraB family)
LADTGPALLSQPNRSRSHHVKEFAKVIRWLRWMWIALGLCLASVVHAQGSGPALWVVRDADTTVYLFGTMHALKPGPVWFDGKIKAAFEASGEVVLEIGDVDPAEMRSNIAKLGSLPQGASLTERLPPARREAFARALATVGMSPSSLDRETPWMAAVTLSAMRLVRTGYRSDLGADAILSSAARAEGKRVVGLETAELELGVMASLPETEQFDFLGVTLDDFDRYEQKTDEMQTRWLAGDVNGLAAMAERDMRDTPQLARTIGRERSGRFADWIHMRMQQPGVVFVAVSAGLVGGAGNIRERLAASGLKVERIN